MPTIIVDLTTDVDATTTDDKGSTDDEDQTLDKAPVGTTSYSLRRRAPRLLKEIEAFNEPPKYTDSYPHPLRSNKPISYESQKKSLRCSTTELALAKVLKGATKECLETILQKLGGNHHAIAMWIASEVFSDEGGLEGEKKNPDCGVGDIKNDDDDETLVDSPAASDPSTTTPTSITVRPLTSSSKHNMPILSTTLHSNFRKHTGLNKKSNRELAEEAWARYKKQKMIRKRWKAWNDRVFKVEKRNLIPRRTLHSTPAFGGHQSFTRPHYRSSCNTKKTPVHGASQPWDEHIELGKKVIQMEEDDSDYIPSQEVDGVPIEFNSQAARA